jgi:hypothetical protein
MKEARPAAKQINAKRAKHIRRKSQPLISLSIPITSVRKLRRS